MPQPTTADEYVAQLPDARREAIASVRALILETVPDAAEAMTYRMPTYTYHGESLCALASQKQYMSLYMEPELVAAHADELAGLSIGKSCVRFRRLDALPLDTVRAILIETVARIDAARQGD